MYSTCIYCKRSLGTNDVLESFPVGRRLAFDPAKGRLWVVCRRCERWNLTPLEERWEAVEDCERCFTETRLRVSTDNIGLARLKEGLVLIRIGVPMRPEFAAWRYGDQFGRRRQRAILWTAAGIAAVGAVTAGGIAVGIGAGFAPQIPNLILNIPIRAKVRVGGGRVLKFRLPDIQKARFLTEPGGTDWVLAIKHTKGKETFVGEEARRIATQLLPAVNHMSGSKKSVQEAVARIEAAGDPERYLQGIGREVVIKPSPHGYGRPLFPGKPGLIHKLPAPTRLALEMALHEEQEMRALAGELVDLELAWREAEEIARISDNMFTPEGFDEILAEERSAHAAAAAAPAAAATDTNLTE
jgi:hypothetical protein